MLTSNLGFFSCSFWVWRKFWENLSKNYRRIHLIWKFQVWVFERYSFLIQLLILIVLYIYLNWGKRFADRISAKSKNGLFDSRSFKLSVEILKLLLIFLLSYYCWHVFASQSHCYFNDMYLLVMWSLKCLKYIIDWDFQFLSNKLGVLWSYPYANF